MTRPKSTKWTRVWNPLLRCVALMLHCTIPIFGLFGKNKANVQDPGSSLVGIGICEGLLWNCWTRKGMRDWMLAALAISLCLPLSFPTYDDEPWESSGGRFQWDFWRQKLSSTESLEPEHQRERILLRALNPEAVVIAVMTSKPTEKLQL